MLSTDIEILKPNLTKKCQHLGMHKYFESESGVEISPSRLGFRLDLANPTRKPRSCHFFLCVLLVMYLNCVNFKFTLDLVVSNCHT